MSRKIPLRSGGQRRPPGLARSRQTGWQLQEAKARFSELFRRTRAEGPQWITRQGKEAVVMIPAEEFEQLLARTRQPRSLVEFFRISPLAKAGVNLERTRDYGRRVDL